MPWKPPPPLLCKVCDKAVYIAEKLEVAGDAFHKSCFRCLKCEKVLGPGGYAALNGKIYCKPHFKQLFMEKGNYSSGFGEEDPKTRWQQGNGDAPSSPGGLAPPAPRSSPAQKKRSSVAAEQLASGSKLASSLCKGCDKPVYPVEKMDVEGEAFHKSCFRCKGCSIKLDVRTYTRCTEDGAVYCTRFLPKQSAHVSLDAAHIQAGLEHSAAASPMGAPRPVVPDADRHPSQRVPDSGQLSPSPPSLEEERPEPPAKAPAEEAPAEPASAAPAEPASAEPAEPQAPEDVEEKAGEAEEAAGDDDA